MRALLICPSDRANLAFLVRETPLALVSVLDRTLVDYWLEDLATRGVKQVTILCADRPELVRAAVGKGERWGLGIDVVPEATELTREQALAKYQTPESGRWIRAPFAAQVMDRMPGSSEAWSDPKSWFAAVRAFLPRAASKAVGFREFPPGVWTHCRARIASSARLEAPCWIGAHACVGAGSRVGAGSIISHGAYIDDGAEVMESFVAPRTYVGAMIELRESLAWGQGLYKLTTDSCTEVTDEFLLSEVGRRASHRRPTSLLGRIAALVTLVGFSPVLLFALLGRRAGESLFKTRQAVRAPIREPELAQTLLYHELNGVNGIWRRYPELWNIARGEFAWVGNRPLTRQEARMLETDFDRLWLAVAPGIVSLADAEGCSDPMAEETRAHSSFYSVRNGMRSDMEILWRVFARAHRLNSPTIEVTDPVNP